MFAKMKFNAKSEPTITLKNICLRNPDILINAEKKYNYWKNLPYNIKTINKNQEKMRYYKAIIDRHNDQLYMAKIELIFRK